MVVKLDVKDRKLLIALDTNATQPLSTLAKALNLSKEAIAYRMRRLERDGIIVNYITLSHFAKLGMMHFKLYIQYSTIGKKSKDEIIKYLSVLENIGWVASTEGTFDLMFSVRYKTLYEFEDFKDQFFARYDKHFAHVQFAILTEAETKPRYYLLEEPIKNPISFLHCNKADALPLDEEDRNVLRAINTHARSPAHILAQNVGITERILRYRRKELERRGVIVGSKLAINYRKLNYLFFKCFVTLRNLTDAAYSELRTWVRYHPNVVYWIKTLGTWDLELEIEVPSIEEFYILINDFKERFAKIVLHVDSNLVSAEHMIAHS